MKKDKDLGNKGEREREREREIENQIASILKI